MLMSWFIFLGAAVGVRENYHLGFDVLLYVAAAGRQERAAHRSRDLVVLAFGVGMIGLRRQLVELHLDTRIPRSASPAAATTCRWSSAAC